MHAPALCPPLCLPADRQLTLTCNVLAAAVFSFGAVCPQGYGLAYTVGDDDIVVQISNFVSDPSTGGSGFGGVTLSANGSDVLTDGGRFRGEIERALLDMQALFK